MKFFKTLAIPIAFFLIILPNGNDCAKTGKFYGSYIGTDINGNVDTYYRFKSNDNEVWWDLTASEMGFIPNGDAEYILVYDNNETASEYDDVFLYIGK